MTFSCIFFQTLLKIFSYLGFESSWNWLVCGVVWGRTIFIHSILFFFLSQLSSGLFVPPCASSMGFFIKILFIFRARGVREKERERNIDVWEKHPLVASCTPPTGDLAQNPSMCPDRESNQLPFCSQADAQSTKPHQPRAYGILIHVTF